MLNDYIQYRSIKYDLIKLIKANSMASFTPEMTVSEALKGSIKFYDAVVLKRLLMRHKPKSILEVGSFVGLSSRWLLEVSRAWGAKVVAVDPNIPHRIFQEPHIILRKLNEEFISSGRLEVAEYFFGKLIKCPYYYQAYEVSRLGYDKEKIDEILESKPIFDERCGKKYDFIFIDGEHAYDNVKNDFETALKLLNKNGHIVFHDAFSHKGVTRLLQEIGTSFKGRAKVCVYGRLIHSGKTKIIRWCLRKCGFDISTDGIGLFSCG